MSDFGKIAEILIGINADQPTQRHTHRGFTAAERHRHVCFTLGGGFRLGKFVARRDQFVPGLRNFRDPGFGERIFAVHDEYLRGIE